MRQSEGVRKIFNLPEIVVVMDQALYAKACEVAWKHKDLYAEVLLRLGTFQPIFNLLSIIGKRFQDAGLRYVCTESGIIAEGLVSDVLKGDVQSCRSSSQVHIPGLTSYGVSFFQARNIRPLQGTHKLFLGAFVVSFWMK